MNRLRSDQPDHQLDCLSNLPEALLLHIISFLPTKLAVRASLLSRPFRHLWSLSPSIDLDRSEFPKGRQFVGVANRCFSRRDPAAPLYRLSLKTCSHYPLPTKSLSKWLATAHSKGLRHLSLHIDQETIEKILPLILSFHSLEYLFIDNLQAFFSRSIEGPLIVPPTFNLINLKSLHLSAQLKCSELTLLLSRQKKLEYLSYETLFDRPYILNLSSPTVKILKQNYSPYSCFRSWDSGITFFFPVLESLDLRMKLDSRVQYFNAYMPLLRNASIKISGLVEGYISVFGDLLRSLINVEELELRIEDLFPKQRLLHGTSIKINQKIDEYPFHILVNPGNEIYFPTFPNLKRLKLSMCFHELSIEDLVCFLHNSPVLGFLQLVHVAHHEYWGSNKSPNRTVGYQNYRQFQKAIMSMSILKIFI